MVFWGLGVWACLGLFAVLGFEGLGFRGGSGSEEQL